MKKESLSVRFLYKTTIGRCLLRLLVQPKVSNLVGKLLETSFSRCFIPYFIKKHQIDMSEYSGMTFRSFNDFFTRKREEKNTDYDPKQLISPCDGHLSVYNINDKSIFNIKNVAYDLESLLQDKELAKRYKDGLCLIFRLTPQEYHRYCFACDGTPKERRIIQGKLHCVRPIAYTLRPVFIENSREYVAIQTEHFGKVIQMEVGALFVGRIHNHQYEQQCIQGKEKGYFEFGGSTIVLLLEKDQILLDPYYLKEQDSNKEIDVHLGDVLGISAQ